jgi:hypothetical protein
VPLLVHSSLLGAWVTKALITGFLQGVTGAISGLLPAKRNGKKTASRNTVSTGRRLAGRPRSSKERNKTRRVRSGTGRKGHLRKALNPSEATTDNSSATSTSQTVIYSCPACGLQAPKTLMVEHLQGSPIHQRGPAQPEQATDHGVVQEPAGGAREEDSRDSLRNLLQILLPPRAFGRRHEQKTAPLSRN